MDDNDTKARQALLHKLLAAHAQRLQQGCLFSVMLGAVYPDQRGRLHAYKLPFVADAYFNGTGSFDQRVELLTVQVTAEPERSLIAARMVPGFTALAVVANAIWGPAYTALTQHVYGCLLAALVMPDDTFAVARWNLASGICDFPSGDDTPPWDLDSMFQLLYALDDLQADMVRSDPAGRKALVAMRPGGDDEQQRVALPARAQMLKPPAAALLLDNH